MSSIERIIEAASNNPECFKCRNPITDLDQVRIITVRIEDEPVEVWVHADHAKPGWAERTT